MTEIRRIFSEIHRLPPDGGLPVGGARRGRPRRNASKCQSGLGDSPLMSSEQHRESG